MAIDITVPDPGESIGEVQIGQWYKSEGDSVEKDEDIVEIESDKASMDLPAPEAGTLVKIAKQTGETAEVNDVIGSIEPGESASVEDGETSSEGENANDGASNRRESEAPKANGKDLASDRSPQKGTDHQAGRNHDEEAGDTPEKIEPRPRVMPPAKPALVVHNLEAADVKGTGPAGRVLQEDVLRHVQGGPTPVIGRDSRDAEGIEAGRPGTQRGARPKAVRRPEDRRVKIVPMSHWRRSAATRLVETDQALATATTFAEIDISAALDLHERYAALFEDAVTGDDWLIAFVAQATLAALQRENVLNAEVRNADVAYRPYVDLGIGVDTDYGLVVPVIRDADLLSFVKLEQAVANLTKRAHEKTLNPDELESGTFTIIDNRRFEAVLSAPQVSTTQSAILGLHGRRDRPVAHQAEIVIRPVMDVALSYDRRITDDRQAMSFLADIRRHLEDPRRLLLEI